MTAPTTSAAAELLREELADLAHEMWAGWMRYMFRRSAPIRTGEDLVVPAELAKRWGRQMITPYANLPENEKESDRAEADRMLAVMNAYPCPERIDPLGEVDRSTGYAGAYNVRSHTSYCGLDRDHQGECSAVAHNEHQPEPPAAAQVGEEDAPKTNEGAVALLDSWLAMPTVEDDGGYQEQIHQQINENSLSDREHYPSAPPAADEARAREFAEGLTSQLFEVEGFGDYTNHQQREGVVDLAFHAITLACTAADRAGWERGLREAAEIALNEQVDAEDTKQESDVSLT